MFWHGIYHGVVRCVCVVQGVMLPRRSAVAYPVGGRRFVWTCISPVEELAAKGMDVSALRTQGKLKTGLDKGVQQSGQSGQALGQSASQGGRLAGWHAHATPRHCMHSSAACCPKWQWLDRQTLLPALHGRVGISFRSQSL